jgi:hypothetical protein
MSRILSSRPAPWSLSADNLAAGFESMAESRGIQAMVLKHHTPKWKIHLFFASLLPLAFGLELTIRLLAGSEDNIAAAESFKQVNLFLLLFHLALWYRFARGRIGSDGEQRSDIVTLNLNDKEI